MSSPRTPTPLRPDADRLTPERRTDALVAAAVGLLATLVAWYRLSPVARGTLWAEDGAVFLAEAAVAPLHETVFAPYAGYLHVVPRVIADLVVSLVPSPGWGLAVTAASCAVAGAVAAGILVLARGVVPSLPARTALAAATVAAPLLPLEVLGNLANVHWLLLWLTPWLLAASAAGRARQWALAAVTFVVVTTEVQSFLFAPLLLWRPRARGAVPRLVAMTAGLVLQAHAVLTTPRPSNGGVAPGLGEVLLSWLHVVVLPWALGTGSLLAAGAGDRGTVLAIAIVVLVGAAVALVTRYGTRPQAVAAGMAPLAGLLLWAAGVVINTAPTRRADSSFELLRYAYVPSVLLVVPVVLALAVLPVRRVRRVATAAVALPVVAALVLSPAPAGARGDGPAWEPQERDASRSCGSAPAPDAVAVPIAPPGWATVVPCDELD